jgi:hypothetical protein
LLSCQIKGKRSLFFAIDLVLLVSESETCK